MTDKTEAQPNANRMPIIFAGHGSPMNAVTDNRWSRGFAELSRGVPSPRAILAISAHWFVPGTFVTGQSAPRTLHDFGGFPPALYEIEYPAPGRPDLAQQVATLLADRRASVSEEWGLDHGTWSVLRFMYPDAKVPVVQLSIDHRLSPEQHLNLGRSLSELRDQGVLIFASGNVTHNLRDAMGRMGQGTPQTPEWAQRFDLAVKNALEHHDSKALLKLWPGSDDGRLAHPSPDHFLPLLYAFGASDDRDAVRFSSEGFDLGSLSMRNVILG